MSLTGRREYEDFDVFEEHFPALETRNGQMLSRNNRHAARLARKWRKAQVAGSDAHTLASAGSTYTEVAGARNKNEFLAGLRAGWGRPRGDSGNYWKLTSDVLQIALGMMSEKRWTLTLAPLAALIPVATLGNCALETASARCWRRRIPFAPGNRVAKSPAWRSKPLSDGATL